MADAEAIYVALLSGQFPDARVCTELPAGFEKTLPVLRVTRISGPSDRLGLDAATLDVDVFATDRLTAKDLAYEADGWLLGLTNTATTAGCLYRSHSINGPVWVPYDNTSVSRFVFTHRSSTRQEGNP